MKQNLNYKRNTLKDLDFIIKNNIENVKKLGLEKKIGKNIEIATTYDELIKIMQLRSYVYSQLNYSKEFSEKIKGFDFDKFDINSILLFYKKEKNIIGTSRIILDSELGLQSEKLYNFKDGFNNFRKINKKNNLEISEISRTIINPKYQCGGCFKNLLKAKYILSKKLKIGNYLSAMTEEMYINLYSRFGMKIIKKISNYGEIKKPCLILSWPTNNFSAFFKKIISEKKKNK